MIAVSSGACVSVIEHGICLQRRFLVKLRLNRKKNVFVDSIDHDDGFVSPVFGLSKSVTQSKDDKAAFVCVPH